MGRRPPTTPGWGRPGAGIECRFQDVCHRCGNDILVGQRMVRAGSGWIHKGCASGQDD